MKDKTTSFSNVIGQDAAKKKANFFLKGHKATGVIPHLMWIAGKGQGKTSLAREVAKQLLSNDSDRAGRPKKYYEINCSTIKNVKQLVNQVLLPKRDEEYTILFDEASEFPKDVTMALLTILNPNKDNRTSFSYDEYTLDFDFSRQSFMFATTEAQQVFHALMDRTERIDLDEYSYAQLAQIIALHCEGKSFADGVLEDMATVVRGNARGAAKMATKIATFLAAKRKNTFTKKHWAEFKEELSIMPLGLNAIEISLLRYLTEKKDCSLTYLASKTGLTKACLQRDFEMYLQKMNLMEITTAGRCITAKGQEILAEIGEPAE